MCKYSCSFLIVLFLIVIIDIDNDNDNDSYSDNEYIIYHKSINLNHFNTPKHSKTDKRHMRTEKKDTPQLKSQHHITRKARQSYIFVDRTRNIPLPAAQEVQDPPGCRGVLFQDDRNGAAVHAYAIGLKGLTENDPSVSDSDTDVDTNSNRLGGRLKNGPGNSNSDSDSNGDDLSDGLGYKHEHSRFCDGAKVARNGQELTMDPDPPQSVGTLFPAQLC